MRRKLKVVLMADDYVVAEASDEKLWRAVLDAVYRNDNQIEAVAQAVESRRPVDSQPVDSANPPRTAGGAITEFADELKVSVDQLQGACRPSANRPYITLDHHHWEAMKRSTPPRGPQAVSPIVLAGSIVALWAKHSKIDHPTINDLQEVLSTVNTRDKNPSRGITNCPWLQRMGNRIVLNPAQISDAIRLAKRYCQKSWNEEGD